MTIHQEQAAGRKVAVGGNLGSEVGRICKWQARNPKLSEKAFVRALKLLDLTISDPQRPERGTHESQDTSLRCYGWRQKNMGRPYKISEAGLFSPMLVATRSRNPLVQKNLEHSGTFGKRISCQRSRQLRLGFVKTAKQFRAGDRSVWKTELYNVVTNTSFAGFHHNTLRRLHCG